MRKDKNKSKDKINVTLINYANKSFTQSQKKLTKSALNLGNVSTVISYSLLLGIDFDSFLQEIRIIKIINRVIFFKVMYF